MPRGQDAGSEIQQPLLPTSQQQQQQQPNANAAPNAPSARPARGTAASTDADALTKWGPIAVVVLVLVFCAAFAGTIVLLSGGPGGDPAPMGRKGCAAAVIGDRQVLIDELGDAAAIELDKKHPRGEPGPRLLIWGGKGRHQAIFDDLYELDLIKGRWRRMAPRAETEEKAQAEGPPQAVGLDSPMHASSSRRLLGDNTSAVLADQDAAGTPLRMPPGDGLPRGRWKMVSAGIPTRHGDGMVIFGGDTLVTAENKGDYLNDVWQLRPEPHGSETAVWHPATPPYSEGRREEAPEGRRAAAGAVWHGPGQATPPRLLVHGGRNKQGDQLNDLWSASLEGPSATWTLLDDGRHTGPRPRKGHTATMRPGTAAHLLIYGGRNEEDYFDDLWAYDVEFNAWEQWLKAGSGGPLGRDHHAAVVVGNQFIIYGGRGGVSYKDSKILSDMWSLDLTTMNWTEIKSLEGPQPPARFLHSFDMFLPRKNNDSLPDQQAPDAFADGVKPALRGALAQDEHLLAGRRLLGAHADGAAGLAAGVADRSSGGTARPASGGHELEGLAGGPWDHEDNTDGEKDDMEDEDADDHGDEEGEGEDEDEAGEDTHSDGSDDELQLEGYAPSLAAAAGTAESGGNPSSVADLSKHHRHHKHHKHHKQHDKKHDKKHKKGHQKHHKGGVDPDPAEGSYSDAKLVVFGGQGEGGCYLNDAWEFNPATSLWRQISPIVSDDRKCIGLEGQANGFASSLRSSVAGSLQWLSQSWSL